MTVHIVKCVDDSRSFVVISDRPPEPSVHIDWYWQFSKSENPFDFLLTSERVWINTEPEELQTLLKQYPCLLERERIYVTRSLIKTFNQRNRTKRDVYVIDSGIAQENNSHVRT